MKRLDKDTLILIVTRRCNLRCPYCKVIKSDCDMSFETAWKAVSLFLEGRNFIHKPLIRFFGGEPLLNFDVVGRIVNRVGKKFPNTNFDLSTNGLLMDKEKVNFFRDNPNLKLIISSMHKEFFESRAFLDVCARLPGLSVTINLLPGKIDSAEKIFTELWQRGVKKFKFLPAYYVRWPSREKRSLKEGFETIRKKIENEKMKIEFENMEHKNPTPLFSSALTVDCGGDVYLGNYFLDKDINKYGDMLKLDNVHTLSDWRAVSDFPLSIDPNYILKKTLPKNILTDTIEVDRSLTNFLNRVVKI